MDAFKFNNLRIRLEEIADVKRLCDPVKDSFIIHDLNQELLEIETELKTIQQPIDMTNILMFDQMKRKKPLKHQMYFKPADVINLAEYKAKKALKKVG